MTLRNHTIRKLTEIVGPARVLTDLEDLYVYSFETLFEEPKYSHFDAVVKAVSEDEIARIAELAAAEGFNVLHRGKNTAIYGPQDAKRSGTIILDTISVPETTAFDEKLRKKSQHLREYRQKLMDAMRKERSYKGLVSVMASLFEDKGILQCGDCEVCTGYCTVSPTFSHVETYSAKGKHLLTKGLMKGELTPSRKLADTLFSCTLCGLCYAQCLPDLHLHDAILEARGRLAEEGLAPESVKAALRNITAYGNPMGVATELRTRWMKKLPENLLKKNANVLYWAGCNTTLRSGVRSTANATVRVLDAAGVDVMALGEREGCCGFSLVVGGLFGKAKRNAERVVEAVDAADVGVLVTSCSGCYETFVDLYPNKLGVEMSCQVLHSSQLTERLVKDGELALGNLPMKVSYHDPCGLGRHCGVYEAPRNVLRPIPGLQLVEPDLSRERSRCCGGGGGFWGVNSSASMSLAHLRIEQDIMPLNVEALAVTCPLCYTNFLYTLRRHRVEMKVYDVMELVEMALGEENAKFNPA